MPKKRPVIKKKMVKQEVLNPKKIVSKKKVIAKKIKNEEITDKLTAWNELKDLNVPDDKKIKLLNFYLGILDCGTFNKVFNSQKKRLLDLSKKLKKKD